MQPTKSTILTPVIPRIHLAIDGEKKEHDAYRKLGSTEAHVNSIRKDIQETKVFC